LDFPGCLLVVSHDRYFMDKIVDHLFVFRGEGVIDDFPGNYSDFRDYENNKPKLATSTVGDKKDWKQEDSSRLTYNEQKELKNLESKLKSLEYDKKALEAKFNDPSLSSERIKEMSEQLKDIIATIETKELRWLELHEKLES